MFLRLAQTLLDILEDTKAQHEQEQLELREAAKSEQERQAEASKRSKRNHTPSTSRNIQSSGASNANGQSPPVRPERSKERSASTQPSSSTSQQSTIPSLDSTPQNAEQETGFSAFRSHLSHFLSTSDSSSVSRRPENHLTYNATTSFDMIRTYLSRFIHSRLLKFMLAFFIVTGFWRRRMARSGKKLELGKMYGRLRDKVVETVKMGGSLGFL